MIENNLLHFENDSTFQTEKTNIKEDSITFVKDSKKVYTHNKEYNMVNWGVLKKPEYKAGDICLVNNNTLEKLIIPADNYTLESYPADSYTPIGVVVVPNTHADDGTARVISLASMDYNNPDNGSTEGHVNMAWGGYGNISTLGDKDTYPCIAEDIRSISGEQQIIGWYDSNSPSGLSSSDYFNTYPNPYDEGTYYRSKTVTSTYKALPSPYLTGGSKNEIYHDTSNTGNVLADMNGKSNTAAILAVDNKSSTDWQTAVSITNTGEAETIHPAAQCCWRYHTVGTQQGDWYLPSAGELGYLCARWKAINNSIDKLVSSGVEALVLPVGNILWSSTEDSSNYADYLHLNNYQANLFVTNKDSNQYVRAFLAV